MPQTAANVRTVPTEKICSGSAAKRTSAESPIACAPVIGRSSRRVARKTATTRPGPDGGGIRAADEHEEKDRCQQQHASRRLPPTPSELQREGDEPRREHDVQARHDEQVIQAAATVAGDHAAVELRGAAEQERGERSAHVALERRIALPVAGGRRGTGWATSAA